MRLRSGRIIYKEKMCDIEVANILLSLKQQKKFLILKIQRVK